MPRHPRVRATPSRWLVFAISWMLLGVLSVGWAVTTPVSASPDEPAHMVKAASVARGQLVGDWSELGQVVQVPLYIAYTHSRTCTAFEPGRSADCQVEIGGDTSGLVDSTTTAGLYNPVYYGLIGWPTLFIGDVSGVYVMRIVSAVLASLFLAFAACVAFTLRRRSTPLAALAIGSPPMLFFLSGAVNPNAVETTATIAAFAAMMAIVRQPDRTLLPERSLILMASAAVAVNTRAVSPLWVLIALVIPLVLAGWPRVRELARSRWVQASIVVVAVATGFAVFWTVHSATLPGQRLENFQEYPGAGTSPVSGFIHMVRELLGYSQAMVGNFGWLDTPAPLVVYFIWAVLSGALIFGAISILRGRSLVAAIALIAAFVVVPAAIQGVYVTNGGYIWQGRYNLALFAILCYGLGQLIAERLSESNTQLKRRALALVWVGWAYAQLVCFAIALQRYAVGADGTWGQVIRDPDWTAPGGNLTWLILATAAIFGIATLGWVCGWRQTSGRHEAEGANAAVPAG
ncbi:DUF2142 domain-containing protein [Agromyces badenianii]|uniref:DUF2142 domain-containing protein n=1 Tax=Agromyces badenianii TaxID=2080742 RepID=UPI0014050D6E|nr:DUF2142 domain-containing protein [Agromyces badenianii]